MQVFMARRKPIDVLDEHFVTRALNLLLFINLVRKMSCQCDGFLDTLCH